MEATNTPSSTVAGLFRDSASADEAIRDLRSAGFSENQIEEFSGRRNADGGSDGNSGGVMNAIANFFGNGPAADRQDGRDTRDLVGLGLPEEDARYFQTGLDNGGVLVVLMAGTRAMEALGIFERYGADTGAVHFDDTIAPLSTGMAPATGSRLTSDVTSTPATAVVPTTEARPTADLADTRRIELLKEVLRVNKQRVQYGEVQLRKEVITEKQTIEVPTIREELVIERHPVAEGEATTSTIGEGETIRVPLTEERVSVDKRSVVAEEVTIGKREVQQTERVEDSVRHEELRTDADGNVVTEQRPNGADHTPRRV